MRQRARPARGLWSVESVLEDTVAAWMSPARHRPECSLNPRSRRRFVTPGRKADIVAQLAQQLAGCGPERPCVPSCPPPFSRGQALPQPTCPGALQRRCASPMTDCTPIATRESSGPAFKPAYSARPSAGVDKAGATRQQPPSTGGTLPESPPRPRPGDSSAKPRCLRPSRPSFG